MEVQDLLQMGQICSEIHQFTEVLNGTGLCVTDSQGQAGVEIQPGSLVWRGLLSNCITEASGTVILT